MAATLTTTVPIKVVGADFKRGVIKAALDAYATGGYDISSVLTELTTVHGITVMGDEVADMGATFNLVGTAATGGGITASTAKLAAVWSDTGSADLFPEVDNAHDFTGVVLTLVVQGV